MPDEQAPQSEQPARRWLVRYTLPGGGSGEMAVAAANAEAARATVDEARLGVTVTEVRERKAQRNG